MLLSVMISFIGIFCLNLVMLLIDRVMVGYVLMIVRFFGVLENIDLLLLRFIDIDVLLEV